MSRRTRTLLPSDNKLLRPKVAVDVREEKEKMKCKQAFYYNENARDLPPLKKGDTVRIQPLQNHKKQWKKANVQSKVNVRSYEVRTEDGGTYRRNRRHFKAIEELPVNPTTPINSTTLEIKRRS